MTKTSERERKTGRFAGCLLVSDLDGTLVSAGMIPEKNLEAVRYFIKEGGRFALATGRSIEAARPFAMAAGSNCASIVFNGAIGYDYEKETSLWQESLPAAAKAVIPGILKRFPQIGVEVHSGRKLYVLNRTPDVDWHIAYEGIQDEDAAFADVKGKDWTKVLFAMGEETGMAALHGYCEGISLEGAYFLKTADCYYELTCGGVSKGAALSRLAGLLGVDKARTFAIGDYYNDVELVQAAGVGCLVETAPRELHGLAQHIACSCEKGAVADFIAYLDQTL